MIEVYTWEEHCLYSGALEIDETGPMPPRSTPTKPMKLTGTQVAQWQGQWVKLAERPIPTDPQPAPEPVPDWPALIATRRWKAETGGTVINGLPIDTDDRSKLLINGAAMQADRNADYVLRWKTSQGFVDLSAAQVLAVADAVSENVQLCFDREDALLGAVADGSIAIEMLGEGWPA